MLGRFTKNKKKKREGRKESNLKQKVNYLSKGLNVGRSMSVEKGQIKLNANLVIKWLSKLLIRWVYQMSRSCKQTMTILMLAK